MRTAMSMTKGQACPSALLESAGVGWRQFMNSGIDADPDERGLEALLLIAT